MEGNEILYPVGCQDFAKIRKQGMLYVDKTAFIYEMVKSYGYVFLSRPRRFGKTLLTSTLHYYLSGRKDLFTGLAIEKQEKDWIQYLVLHFDLSRTKELTPDELRQELNEMLNDYDELFGVKTKGAPGNRLDRLIQTAHRQTGHPAVVLIDEYDAPIMDALHEPDRLSEVRKVMRNFYTSLKANDSILKFVFITGVSTFSQMGIFSELNNLNKITNDDKYAAICGITEQELKDNFKQGIKHLAEEEECTPEEMLAILKDKYDGYHFTEAFVDIYNPFSLLNAFDKNKLGDYWFDSGTSTTLVRALERYVGNFQKELNKIEKKEWMNVSQFTRSLEDHATLIPLLYQSGYLTIKAYNKKEKSYLLDYPNAEVRVGLLKNLLPLFSSVDPDDTANAALRASIALREGDIETAMNHLRSLLKSIPYGNLEPKIFSTQERTISEWKVVEG
jgi:hypothetical protein